jgi:hypothetical protein
MEKFLIISSKILKFLNITFLLLNVIVLTYGLVSLANINIIIIPLILILYFSSNLLYMYEKNKSYFGVLFILITIFTLFSIISSFINHLSLKYIFFIPLFLFHSFQTYVIEKSE